MAWRLRLANADCKPAYLVQFAQMGAAYVERVLHTANPRVALLNIGEEEGKGSQLVQETYRLLQTSRSEEHTSELQSQR